MIDPCPHCNRELDAGDVYEILVEMPLSNRSAEKNIETAREYGWTPENKKRFSKKVGCYDMIEDRVTHYICPFCDKKL
jgi:hypothetical protein